MERRIDDIILQKLIDKKITLCIFILAGFFKKYPDYFKGKRLKSKWANIDLPHGITGVTEIVHNPSYEMLFEEETKAGLEGW